MQFVFMCVCACRGVYAVVVSGTCALLGGSLSLFGEQGCSIFTLPPPSLDRGDHGGICLGLLWPLATLFLNCCLSTFAPHGVGWGCGSASVQGPHFRYKGQALCLSFALVRFITPQYVDVLFAKFKTKGHRRITFAQFRTCLSVLAQDRCGVGAWGAV